MATTGFWPVKGSSKAVIDYADNPDKTTERKYLDDDLAQALEYVANDDKTDRKIYVSGVNCTKDRAYEEMMAVQRRFGLRGTNVAYHGFQSFRPGEVTPEEAHQIGIETARRMWGDKYQVVVTTHLNTNSVHNHIVVHAVSFRDGKKFQNHVRDHIRLREISDQICREHRLSVLEDAPSSGKEKASIGHIRQESSRTGTNCGNLLSIAFIMLSQRMSFSINWKVSAMKSTTTDFRSKRQPGNDPSDWTVWGTRWRPFTAG